MPQTRAVNHIDLSSKLKEYYLSQNTLKTHIVGNSILLDEINFFTCQYPSDPIAPPQNKFELIGKLYRLSKENIYDPTRILILGIAGIGKTTMCHYFAYVWAKGLYEWLGEGGDYKYVFYLPLRNLKADGEEEKQGLAAVIYRECVAQWHYTFSAEERGAMINKIEQALNLENERVLLLLDGCDEVAQRAQDSPILHQILHAAFNTKKWIATSRFNHLFYEFKDVHRFQLAGFDDTQLEKYIRRYFEKNGKPELSDYCLSFLKANSQIWETMRIPFHLELFCDVLWKEGSDNESEVIKEKGLTYLYDIILKFMLRHYLEKKGINVRDQTLKWLCQRCRIELDYLEKLAFVAFDKGETRIQQNLSEQVLDTVDKNANSEESLFNSAAATGLLYTEEPSSIDEMVKTHAFRQLTFQEYLVARYLFQGLTQPDNSSSDKNAENILRNKKFHRRYERVFQFLAGMLKATLNNQDENMDKFWSIINDTPYDMTRIGYFQIATVCLEESYFDFPASIRKDVSQKIVTWFQSILTKFYNTGIEGAIAQSYYESLLQLLERFPIITIESGIIDVLQGASVDPSIQEVVVVALKRLCGSIVSSERADDILGVLLKIVTEEDTTTSCWDSAITTLKEYMSHAKLSASIKEKVFQPLLQEILGKNAQRREKAISILSCLGESLSPFILESKRLLNYVERSVTEEDVNQTKLARIIGHLCMAQGPLCINLNLFKLLIRLSFSSNKMVRKEVVASLARLTSIINNDLAKEQIIIVLLRLIITDDEVKSDAKSLLASEEMHRWLIGSSIAEETLSQIWCLHIENEGMRVTESSSFTQNINTSDNNRDQNSYPFSLDISSIINCTEVAIRVINELGPIIGFFPKKIVSLEELLRLIGDLSENVERRRLAMSLVKYLPMPVETSLIEVMVNTLINTINYQDEILSQNAIESLIHLKQSYYIELNLLSTLFDRLFLAAQGSEKSKLVVIRAIGVFSDCFTNPLDIKKLLNFLLEMAISSNDSQVQKSAKEQFAFLCSILVHEDFSSAIVFEILLGSVKSSDMKICEVAVKALWHLSKELERNSSIADQLFTIILYALEINNNWIRRAVFEILGSLVTKIELDLHVERIANALIESLSSTDKNHTSAALATLGRLKLNSSSFSRDEIDDIKKALSEHINITLDENPVVWKAASRALWQWNEFLDSKTRETLIDKLLEGMKCSNNEIQKAAIDLLGEISRKTQTYSIVTALLERIGFKGESDQTLLATLKLIPFNLVISNYVNNNSQYSAFPLVWLAFLQGIPLTVTEDGNIKYYINQIETHITTSQSVALELRNTFNSFLVKFEKFKETSMQGSNEDVSTTAIVEDSALINSNRLPTSLIEACTKGDISQLNVYYQEHTVPMEVTSQALLLASRCGHIELVKNLLDDKKAFITLIQDEQGNTPMHFAAQGGHVLLMDEFKKRGLSLTAENQDKQQPLHQAVWHNQLAAVKYLINKAPNRYAAVSFGQYKVAMTPLHIAVLRGHLDMVKLLLPTYSTHDRNVVGIGNLFHLAVFTHQSVILEYLLNQPHLIHDVEEFNEKDQTPLALAAWLGNLPAIYLLVKKSADINKQNHQGDTPLHFAIKGHQFEIIDEMVALKASLIKTNSQGKSAFALAKKEVKEAKREFEQAVLADKQTAAHQLDRCQRIRSLLETLGYEQEHKQYRKPNFTKIRVKNLVFQGGGPKGIAEIGALQQLEIAFKQQGYSLSEIKRVAGTSAGGIVSALLAIGYPVEQIEKTLRQTKIESFLDGVDLKKIRKAMDGPKLAALSSLWEWHKVAMRTHPSVLGHFNPLKELYHTPQLCSGDTFRDWIEAIIHQQTGIPFMTFGELHQQIQAGKPYKELYVLATQLGVQPELIVFNSEDEKYKDYIIADAIRASMSIPFVFKPYQLRIKHNGKPIVLTEYTYVDGGLLQNFPIDLFDKVGFQQPFLIDERKDFPIFNSETLGLSLDGNQPQPTGPFTVDTVKDLGEALAHVYWQAEQLLSDLRGTDSLRSIAINNCGVNTLDFDIDEATQNKLIQSGREAVLNSSLFVDELEQFKTAEPANENTNTQRIYSYTSVLSTSPLHAARFVYPQTVKQGEDNNNTTNTQNREVSLEEETTEKKPPTLGPRYEDLD